MAGESLVILGGSGSRALSTSLRERPSRLLRAPRRPDRRPGEGAEPVYRVGRVAAEVGFYDHHRWAAPPGRLVATALAAGLAGPPGLAAVEPARVNGDYSALLAGRVIALEEIDLPERQLARIQVDLKLFDENGALVWSRLVTVEDEGRAEDVADVMRQMQSAFAKLVAEVRVALESFLGRRDAQDHDGSFRP